MPTQWGLWAFFCAFEHLWTLLDSVLKAKHAFFLHNHGWRWLETSRYSFHHGLCGENVRKPNLKPEMHCLHVSHCCLPVLVGWRAAKLELRTILSRVCSAVPWHFRTFSTWKTQIFVLPWVDESHSIYIDLDCEGPYKMRCQDKKILQKKIATHH